MSMPTAIHWLTRDFRLGDNPALAAAARGPMRSVFFIDAQLLAQGAASRWRLERALRDFDAALRQRGNAGVTILRGEPHELLPRLVAALGAAEVHQSDWPCPAMRASQQRVDQALRAQGAQLVLHPGHLLIHPRLLRTKGGGAYRVFTPFARALRGIGADRPGAGAPPRIPTASGAGWPQSVALGGLDLAPDLHGGRAVLDAHALPAGEAAALARLDDFLDRASEYEARRDRPDIEATSGLSEALALGEISPRSVWAIAEARRRDDPAAAEGIAKFMSELCWREFAWHLLIEFPQMAERAWRPEWAEFPWRGDNADFDRWRQARTGIALVDAGLREMRVTGRMHNRVRMVVASWLTKHLLTDWRLGLAHFQDSLSDWDPAANAMNWQWVAGCGPDAAPFFRIFNPERQAERFDPRGDYRRAWLGPGAAGALAYDATLPPDWRGKGRPPADEGTAAIAAGRQRALDAHAGFRDA
ncbi:deoxyribodipyrimidine photo-lyase [Paracoccus sp. (in: a-proteobacteria)]|uniref:cryptochrome/photolyase family protein n=1 Tax=Paracoccus sp. TaxID=267 RepID=UPI0035B135A8